MANFANITMVDRLFKWMFGKSRGDNSSQFFEENITTSFDVHASEIYAQPIPSTPPTTTNSIVKKWYPSTESGDGSITLTRDRKVNGGRCWVAVNNWSSNWSSGSADLTQIMKNFISPKYGRNYVVQVFDGNGNQIPELDNASWLFDYKAGVLTFETDRWETGNTVNDSIKIKTYQYVGSMLDNFSTPSNTRKEVFLLEADNIVDFTLSSTPSNLNNLDVYFNGMMLDCIKNEDYTLTSNVLTINYPTYKNDIVIIKYN